MDSYLSSVAARSNPRTARFLFSSSGNSPSGRHFTLMNLLCITLQGAVYSRELEKARKKYKKYKFLQLRKRIRNRGIFSIFSKTLSICFYKNQTIIKEKTVQEESLWQF